MATDLPLLAVVDDDADVRIALTRLLASAGFAVEAYASGLDFLRSLEHHEPNCAVLDLHMPQMSGSDVQEALACRHPVPVVVITGQDSPESRARAMRLGAKHYLCKPIDDEALFAAIRDAIGECRDEPGDADPAGGCETPSLS
jgi:FixJ family two-component response regulator